MQCRVLLGSHGTSQVTFLAYGVTYRLGKIKAWLDERFNRYRLIEATHCIGPLGTVDRREHRLILLEVSGVAEPMGIAQTFNNPSIRHSHRRLRRLSSSRPEE